MSSPLAPASLEGDSFTIAIADIAVTLDLSACDEPARWHMISRYRAFQVPERPAAMTIQIQTESGPAFIPPESFPTWRVHTSLHNGRLAFESFFEAGWLERAGGQGALRLRLQGDPENFLRVAYAWLCLDGGALLLHASGAVRDGKGYVFFGPSGSGKTTAARHSLSVAATVLSDDLVVVKKVSGKYRVFGVPFRGTLPAGPGTNASAELGGLFALVKDNRHALEPLRPSEAVVRLAACVPFLTSHPGTAARVTDICIDLAASVPVQSLHFWQDAGFWDILTVDRL